MKIWIVKYDDGEQVGECYACGSPISAVEVDIDELAKDWIKDCTAVTIYETTMIEKPFSEFLQERMK